MGLTILNSVQTKIRPGCYNFFSYQQELFLKGGRTL